MPDVKIKGYSGNELEYPNVPKVYLAAPESTPDNPVLVPFTYGEAIEGVEVELDFSDGDMQITAPDGYLIRSGVVKKPETLVPENIAKDVEVAGIVGTHESGSDDLCYVTFMNDDGTVEYGKKAVAVGDDCADPIARGIFGTPTKENTEQYAYTFSDSWATTPNGSSDSDSLRAVTENRTVYAVFHKQIILGSGNCGDNLTWMVTESDQLRISGYGDMYNFSDYTTTGPAPWREYETDITEVLIEVGVTHIGNEAFKNCTAITKISIPDSVTSVGSGIFNGCTGLENFTIPVSISILPSSMFRGCKSLVNVTLHGGITSIGNGAFWGCGFEKITIPDSVANIDSNAFRENESLTSIEIPASTTMVGNSVCHSCTALTNVIIHEGVTRIENNAFRNCTALKNVTIPRNVSFIGSGAFYSCTNLTSVSFIKQSGWYVSQSSTATSGTSVNVSSVSTSASYLKSTYAAYYWLNNT